MADIPMRLTGPLAYHCREQGRGFGQTGAEFARSCIRKELARQGVVWDAWPDGEPSREIPGQKTLDEVPPAATPATESVYDVALREHAKVSAFQKARAELAAMEKKAARKLAKKAALSGGKLDTETAAKAADVREEFSRAERERAAVDAELAKIEARGTVDDEDPFGGA